MAEVIETANKSRTQTRAAARPGRRPATTVAPAISILVCTYRRPHGLRTLLNSIAKQQFDGPRPDFDVIVVDNDVRRSAEPTCTEFNERAGFKIRYAVEANRGIANARNRTVDMLHPDTEFGVFVDDDEHVTPTWLAELLRAQHEHNADAVIGPVDPDFIAPPPKWVTKGKFFERLGAGMSTGDELRHGYTGNALVRTSVFTAMGVAFDKRYALSGGEDTRFFRRVNKAGFKIIWSKEAIAYERVPPSRVNTLWIVQRAYRWGIAAPRIAQEIGGKRKDTINLVGRLWIKLVEGPIMLPVSWIFGWHYTVTCLRRIAFTAGLLAGWYGMRYHEYRKTHGT